MDRGGGLSGCGIAVPASWSRGGREMRMKALLTIVGIVIFCLGLLFMAQGGGWVRWPAESFMIGASGWIWRGAIVAVVGLALLGLGIRRR